MNRRKLLSFLALSPLAVPAAIAASAAATPQIDLARLATVQAALARQSAVGATMLAGRNYQLSPANREAFSRAFIDPVLKGNVDLLESRGFKIDEVCKFMGIRVPGVVA